MCGVKFNEDETPHVDHDHKTGRVRGLAHNLCNLIEGWKSKSPEQLCGIAEHIRRLGTTV